MLSTRCTSRLESDEGNAERGGDMASKQGVQKEKEAKAAVHCMHSAGMCVHCHSLVLQVIEVVH